MLALLLAARESTPKPPEIIQDALGNLEGYSILIIGLASLILLFTLSRRLLKK